MRAIKPVGVDDTTLFSTSIPEDDYPVWMAGAYVIGDKVIKTTTHRIYECLVNTSDDPEVGVLAVPPTWLDIGATRPWRMFDGSISSQSNDTSDIVVVLEPGRTISSVSSFNIEDITSVNITMVDPIEGEVYNRDVDLQDNTSIVDWYTYFFEPISVATEFLVLDLPPYGSAKTTVTYSVETEGRVGELVIGSAIVLGVTNYGTSVQLLDFSRKERDEFGKFTVIKRNTSKLVNFDVTVPTGRVGYIFNQLSKLSTIPMVWVGTEAEDDDTLIYGYYRDFRVDISSFNISDCSIEVEGLT